MPAAVAQETWKNEAPGSFFVRKFDHRGELNKAEVVRGGRVFYITPEERKMNEESCATERQNPFRNGSLSPVRLLDGDEDAAEFASNPHLLSEDDMADLVNGRSQKAFDERLAQLTNPLTLNRFLDVARANDASVKRVDAISERIRQAEPSTALSTNAEPQGGPSGVADRDFKPRGVTPQ